MSGLGDNMLMLVDVELLLNVKSLMLNFQDLNSLQKLILLNLKNTWACLPHTVSLGAQKNFAVFAKSIGTHWGSQGASFDDLWFKRMIAKTIIFKATEKIVSKAEWYEGDYRANIVTYAIAKLVHDAKEQDNGY